MAIILQVTLCIKFFFSQNSNIIYFWKVLCGGSADTMPSVPIFWHWIKIRGKAMTPRLVTAWNQFLIGRARSVSRVPRVLRCRITWMGRGIGSSAGYRLEMIVIGWHNQIICAINPQACDNVDFIRAIRSTNICLALSKFFISKKFSKKIKKKFKTINNCIN